MFSDHNKIKLEMTKIRELKKAPKIWKLSNSFLNDLWVKEEIDKILENISN